MRNIFFILAAIALFSCSEPSGSTPGTGGNSPYSLRKIGSDINDIPGVIVDYGNTIKTLSDGSVLVCNDVTGTINRYIPGTGYDREIYKGADELISSPSGVYFRTGDGLWQINEDTSVVLVEDTAVESGWNVVSSVDDTRFLAAWSDGSDIHFDVLNRGDKSKQSYFVTTAQTLHRLSYVTLYNDRVYIITNTPDSTWLYIIDPVEKKLISSQDLQSIYNITDIGFYNNQIVFTCSYRISVAALDSQGIPDLTGRSSWDIDRTYELSAGVMTGNDTLSVVADFNGLYGVYNYSLGSGTFTPVFEPVIRDDTLYNIMAIEASGSNLWAAAGKSVKLFTDRVYQRTIPVLIGSDYYTPSNLYAFSTGELVMTSNSGNFFLMIEEGGSVKFAEDTGSPGFYGITGDSQGNVILRERNGGTSLWKFDGSEGTFSLLFNDPLASSVSKQDVVVLPSDNILLNGREKLVLCDSSGSVLLDSGIYTQLDDNVDSANVIENIEYSSYHQEILAMTFGSLLLRIDPDTLEIKERIILKDLPAAARDLAVDDMGRIYISTYRDTLHQLVLAN